MDNQAPIDNNTNGGQGNSVRLPVGEQDGGREAEGLPFVMPAAAPNEALADEDSDTEEFHTAADEVAEELVGAEDAAEVEEDDDAAEIEDDGEFADVDEHVPLAEVVEHLEEVVQEMAEAIEDIPVAEVLANHNHVQEDEMDDSDSDDEGDFESTRIINYDQAVPSAHRYLGDDMQDVHGRMIYDEGSEVKLLAYLQRGVVLVPGQTVPIQGLRPNIVGMLRSVVEQQKTFAMLHAHPTDRRSLASIGTTAQILSISSEEEDPGDVLPSVKVIAIGRQRFELLDVSNMLDGLLMAKVKILPEVSLGSPLDDVIPISHFRSRTKFVNCNILTDESTQHGSNDLNKRVHNSCAYFTAWPDWVYKQYLPEKLMERVRDELSKWGGLAVSDLDKIKSIDQMSYWLAANLPLSDKDKIELLEHNSSIQRVRSELKLMQKFVSLCCDLCKSTIAKRSDVFSLSYEGPMGTYVNPHGHIHETMTVYNARHLILVGRPSTEYSWFPGYAWTIVVCRTCQSHKGWKFTATNNQLQPASFYGLTRAGVITGVIEIEDNSRCCLVV